jgi:membrane peptidoglycan carboxypeptidase
VALQKSINTVYYAVGSDPRVGPARVVDMAHAMGVDHIWGTDGTRYDLNDKGDGKTTWTGSQVAPSRISPEVAIGQFGITVQDNAAGIATIAAGGYHYQTHFVMSVSKGSQVAYKEVFKRTDLTSTMHLTPAEIADEAWAMSTVMDNSNGKNKLAGGRQAGAKSGTWEMCSGGGTCKQEWSGQTRDAWWAGFTPKQLATVVHISSARPNENPVAAYYQGNNKKESVMYGITLPGDVWKAYMNKALAGKPKNSMPEPTHANDGQGGEFQPTQDAPQGNPDATTPPGPGNTLPPSPCVPPNCPATLPPTPTPTKGHGG